MLPCTQQFWTKQLISCNERKALKIFLPAIPIHLSGFMRNARDIVSLTDA